MPDIGDVLVRLGDNVCCEGFGKLARVLRPFQRSRGEGPTHANHALIITGRKGRRPNLLMDQFPLRDADGCEALWHHVEQPLLANHRGQRITICRPQGLDADQVFSIVSQQRSYIGDLYPFWQLPIYAIDTKLLGDRVLARRLLFTRRRVCSGCVATSDARGRIYFYRADGAPILPKAVEPDDMMDNWERDVDEHLWKRILWRELVP